jgi:hypothetical protein
MHVSTGYVCCCTSICIYNKQPMLAAAYSLGLCSWWSCLPSTAPFYRFYAPPSGPRPMREAYSRALRASRCMSDGWISLRRNHETCRILVHHCITVLHQGTCQYTYIQGPISPRVDLPSLAIAGTSAKRRVSKSPDMARKLRESVSPDHGAYREATSI